MNRTQQFIESMQQLLEFNPFASLGYSIHKHVVLSPDDKRQLLKKRKRMGDRIETKIPRERKRIVAVYKHADKLYGHIEHKTFDNHPLDSNFYELNKENK